jgi:hypothetical protein
VRTHSKSERVVWVWAFALVIWELVAVVQFPNWPARGIGVLLAVAAGWGFALFMRSIFRQATAKPFTSRAADRWLARQPMWVSGPLIACVYMAVPVAIVAVSASHYHRIPAESVWGLSGLMISACGFGVFWPSAWRESRRRHDLTGVARE